MRRALSQHGAAADFSGKCFPGELRQRGRGSYESSWRFFLMSFVRFKSPSESLNASGGFFLLSSIEKLGRTIRSNLLTMKNNYIAVVHDVQ